MPVVQLPSGDVVSFPDNMSAGDINGAIDQHISSSNDQQGIVPGIKRGMAGFGVGLNQYLNAGDQWLQENAPKPISDALMYEVGSGVPTSEELARRGDIMKDAAQDLHKQGEGTGFKGFVGEALGNPVSYTPGAGLVGQGLAYGTANAFLGPKTEDSSIGDRINQTAVEAPLNAAFSKLSGEALNKLIGPAKTNISADEQRLIDLAKKEGLTLTPGQRTGNVMLQGADKLVAADSNQPTEFTKLVLAKAGINGESASPGILNDAFNRVGGVIGNTPKNYAVPVTNDLLEALDAHKTNNLLTDPEIKKISGYIENVYKGADLDSIPGSHIQSMRSNIGDAMRAARKTNNTEYANALKSLRKTLDDAMDAQMSASDIADVTKARGQYANLKTIAAARKANNENLISPNALASALSAQGKEGFNRGFGNLNELSQVGSQFVNPTQRANKATKLGEILSSSGLGFHLAGPAGAAGGAVAGAIAPYAGKGIYNNRLISNYLVNGVPKISPEAQRLAAILAGRVSDIGANVK